MLQHVKKIINSDYSIFFFVSSFWLGLSQVTTIVRTLLIAVLFARYLAPEKFGLYIYVLAFFYLSTIFAVPGLNVSMFRSVSRGFIGTYLCTVRQVFKFSLIGSVFIFLFSFYLFYSSHFLFAQLSFVLAFLFPLYSISLTVPYFLSGIEAFKKRTIYDFLCNFSVIIVLFVTLYYTDDIFYLVLATIIPHIVCGLIAIYFIRSYICSKAHKTENGAYEYGLSLSFNYILPTIRTHVDKIVIGYFLGSYLVGLYSIAAALADQVIAFSKIIGSLFVNKTSKISSQNVFTEVKRPLIFFIFLFIFIAGVLFIVTPYLILFIFGSQYSAAVPYAQVIILFIPVRSFAVILRNIHEAQKSKHVLFFASNHIVILELFLMIIFLYYFNLWGLIIAKILIDFITVLYYFYFFARNNKR